MIVLGPHVLAFEFQNFARANIPPDASEGQRADMQRAFFGGVLVMMNIDQLLGNLPDDAAGELLGQLYDEAVSFAMAQVVIGNAFTGD
jgi:hypothetical protein